MKNLNFTYRDTVVVEKHAWNKLIGVVVLVRWEQFTQKFAVEVRKCSQVEGKTRRGFQTGKRTESVVIHKISSNACDVQIWKFISLEFAVRRHAICRSSVDSFLGYEYRQKNWLWQSKNFIKVNMKNANSENIVKSFIVWDNFFKSVKKIRQRNKESILPLAAWI